MKFEVLGTVRGKGRPRFARRGSFVNTHTDDKTLSYEGEIKYAFIQSKGVKLDGQVGVKILIIHSPPKSASKKKQLEMLSNAIRPMKKPDVDNVAKVVCDALNKLAYNDDTQVVRLEIYKFYGEQEKLIVEIVPTIDKTIANSEVNT